VFCFSEKLESNQNRTGVRIYITTKRQNTYSDTLLVAEDFKDMSSIGPSRAAEFLGRSDDANFKADVAGTIRELLQKCELISSSGESSE